MTSPNGTETPVETATPDPNMWVDIYSDHLEHKVDVLWVVDNSGSMSQEQQKLADSFAQFIQFFTDPELELDWHLAIITTDVFNTNQRGQLIGGVMYPDTPDIETYFAQAVNVGTSGSGREQGMEAARLALTEPNNRDFLRDDALLSMIFVSDEDDQSFWDDTAGFNCTGPNEETTACTPVQDYIDFFYGLKTRDELVHVSTIVGTSDGCNNSFGSAAPSYRYETLWTTMTGTEETICQETFGPALTHLGEVISDLIPSTYPTTFDADPITIEVRLDDVVIPPGPTTWKYDTDAYAVVFQPGFEPEECQEVKISYLKNSPDPVLSEPAPGMGYDPLCVFYQEVQPPPPEPPFNGVIDGGACATCSLTRGDAGTGRSGVLALGLLLGLALVARRKRS